MLQMSVTIYRPCVDGDVENNCSAGESVIGIAWVANTTGGICSRYVYKPFTSTPPQPAGLYSFNTLVISQRLGAESLVDAIVSITLTHELGHSFGALHDEGKLRCPM